MFTGIVEERGDVLEAGTRLVVAARTVADDAVSGASIAVNGVCLTVVHLDHRPDGSSSLSFHVSEETLARSSFGRLRAGDHVNLERPMTLLSRLGGHLVQGHVDGVGTVLQVEGPEADRRVTFGLPDGLERYVVEKGSIAVDGVSLTVNETSGAAFRVALVPHTLSATTLGALQPGDPVNVEVDVMAKYAEAFLRRMR